MFGEKFNYEEARDTLIALLRLVHTLIIKSGHTYRGKRKANGATIVYFFPPYSEIDGYVKRYYSKMRTKSRNRKTV